jgi:hypothetical protein
MMGGRVRGCHGVDGTSVKKMDGSQTGWMVGQYLSAVRLGCDHAGRTLRGTEVQPEWQLARVECGHFLPAHW